MISEDKMKLISIRALKVTMFILYLKMVEEVTTSFPEDGSNNGEISLTRLTMLLLDQLIT